MYQEDHLASFGMDYEPAFASKQLAMALDGPWNLPRWKQIPGLNWMICSIARRAGKAGDHHRRRIPGDLQAVRSILMPPGRSSNG